MVNNYELESFLFKFRSLCNAGIEASLKYSSVDGQAHLSLSVNLGPSPTMNQTSPSYAPKFSRRRPPSYHRLQVRRRQEVTKNTTEQVVTSSASDENDQNVTEATAVSEVAVNDDELELESNNAATSIEECTVELPTKPLPISLNAKSKIDCNSLAFHKHNFVKSRSHQVADKNVAISKSQAMPPFRKSSRPAPRPNPECCDHACYPEDDAPDGKCCWHRCGRTPWPWQKTH